MAGELELHDSQMRGLEDARLVEQARQLLLGYDRLLRVHFYESVGPVSMQMDFGSFFTSYERDPKLKLDPDNLSNNRRISCSSASVLVGRWWELKKKIEPWFIIGTDQEDPVKQHTSVYLPSAERTEETVRAEIAEYKAYAQSSLLRRDYSSDLLADYTKSSKLQFMPPQAYVPGTKILLRGSIQFLINRLRLFSSVTH